MATDFPTDLDTLTNPTASDSMDSASVPHATQHADANDAIEALQAKVGKDNSAVTTSHDYKISALEAIESRNDVDATTSTTAVDLSQGRGHQVTLKSDTELQFSNIIAGRFYTFKILQNSTGGYFATLQTSSAEIEEGTFNHILTADEYTVWYAVGISSSKLRFYRDPQKALTWLESRMNVAAPNGGIELLDTNYVELNSGIDFGTDDFTIQFIYKSDGVNTGGTQVFGSHTGGNSRFAIQFTGGASLRVAWVNSGGSVTNTDGTYIFPFDNVSHEVFLVFDRDGNLAVYLDGNHIENISISSQSSVDIGASNSNLARLGHSSSGSGFLGTLFVFRAFNFGLSSSQVEEIHRHGVPYEMQFGNLSDIINDSTLNGGFETAGGGGSDVFANWSEQTAGTSTVNDETVDVNSGANACRIDVDGSNSRASVFQSVATIGKLYQATFYSKISDDTGSEHLQFDYGSVDAYEAFSLTTSWTKYTTLAFKAIASTVRWRNHPTGNPASNDSIYIDDVVLRRVGCVVDLDLGFGRGSHYPDLTDNELHGTGTNVSNLIERRLIAKDEAFSSTIDVDFDGPEEIEVGELTGDLTLTGSNYNKRGAVVIFLDCDSTGRNFTFPSNWKFQTSKPTGISADKTATLILRCLGTAEADVRVYYNEES